MHKGEEVIYVVCHFFMNCLPLALAFFFFASLY